jgi:biotin carboxyl carrier protein
MPREPAAGRLQTDTATRARVARDAAERGQDHAAMGRLADDLLPELIGRLAATGLGEIEVREDGWRIRLRRPSAPGASSRPSMSGGHGHLPADGTRVREPRHAGDGRHGADQRHGPDARYGVDGRNQAQSGGHSDGTASSSSGLAAVGPGPDPYRVAATSPAVGVFQPRPEMRPGVRVRAGDRLGAVDLLGVPQDVVAPGDGVIAATLVQAGEGVEYGQQLVLIELIGGGRSGADGDGAAGAAGPDLGLGAGMEP